MLGEKEYFYYRGKKYPEWWSYYLLEEKNPYSTSDTLTLEKGCLSDYWHIHSSNKHYNPKGAYSCNFVQKMVYNEFGGAFLTSNHHFGWGGHQGQHVYREPNHIVYYNAYIGEDDKIHIKNAYQYYEDVILFVMNVLREVSKNHLQSGNLSSNYNFFPAHTDKELQEMAIKAEIQRVKNAEIKKEFTDMINENKFIVSQIKFSEVDFKADYFWDDGWSNEKFIFNNFGTDIDKDDFYVSLKILVPHLYKASSQKKDLSKATKTLTINYGMFFNTKKLMGLKIPIPENQITDEVKKQIFYACTQAMNEYNQTHIGISHNEYYHYNIFLDNNIGFLKLNYNPFTNYPWWV